MRFEVTVFAVKGDVRTPVRSLFVLAGDQRSAERLAYESAWAPMDPTWSPAYQTKVAPRWLVVSDFDIDETRYARFVYDLHAGKVVRMDRLVISNPSYWTQGEAEHVEELEMTLSFTDLLTHPQNWAIATPVIVHQDLPDWARGLPLD